MWNSAMICRGRRSEKSCVASYAASIPKAGNNRRPVFTQVLKKPTTAPSRRARLVERGNVRGRERQLSRTDEAIGLLRRCGACDRRRDAALTDNPGQRDFGRPGLDAGRDSVKRVEN